MHTFKMTGDYASAMVTVIPIILLLGWAEVQKRLATFLTRRGPDFDQEFRDLSLKVFDGLRQRRQEPDPPVGQVTKREPFSPWKALEHIFNVAWVPVAVMHVVAEVYLVRWLATTEQPASPGWAQYIFVTAFAGFVMLLAGAMGPPLMIACMSAQLRLMASDTKFSRYLIRLLLPFTPPALRAGTGSQTSAEEDAPTRHAL